MTYYWPGFVWVLFILKFIPSNKCVWLIFHFANFCSKNTLHLINANVAPVEIAFNIKNSSLLFDPDIFSTKSFKCKLKFPFNIDFFQSWKVVLILQKKCNQICVAWFLRFIKTCSKLLAKISCEIFVWTMLWNIAMLDDSVKLNFNRNRRN